MQEFVWGICVEFRKTSTSTTKETSKSRKISVTEEPYHFRSRTEIISCREGQRSAAATRQRGWRVVGCAKIRPSWRQVPADAGRQPGRGSSSVAPAYGGATAGAVVRACIAERLSSTVVDHGIRGALRGEATARLSYWEHTEQSSAGGQ